MNYCKTRLLPDTATSLVHRIGGDRFSFPLQNWHRAATYIPQMLNTTKIFVYKLSSAATFLDFPIGGDWFAITINKAQAQTFHYVGIDLRFDCFSHGQLYVGLSRTSISENQFILLPHGLQTKNVIYSEIL